jgi:hypothetical protein
LLRPPNTRGMISRIITGTSARGTEPRAGLVPLRSPTKLPSNRPGKSQHPNHPARAHAKTPGSRRQIVPSNCALKLRPAERRAVHRAYNNEMYHYNPSTALEELTEEAALPNPVHVRDMMLRKKLSADEALELNRIFLEYQKFFGETQKLGKQILKRLAGS